MIQDAADKGYEVSANLMAVSRASELEIEQALELLAQTPASAIVVVDSFGSLYAEQIELLVKKYLQYAKPAGKQVGIHAHNNQQLAFANTIEAIIQNVNYLDGTIFGIGRAAGNCPLELLLGFLKNPKFNIRPIIDLLGKEFLGLRDEIEWGYTIPYMLTGILDIHPRAAMELSKTPQRNDYLSFYNKLTVEANI